MYICVAVLRPNLMQGRTRGHMSVSTVRRLIDIVFITPQEIVK